VNFIIIWFEVLKMCLY